nr:L-fucose mutarotase [uncultured Cohaesibacter sp.]
MLKTISPLISPELLMMLHQMGHGDEIVFSDAHFPANSFSDTVLRADGLEVTALLVAIMPLWQLDQYVKDNVVMMAAVEGDTLPDGLVADYTATLPDDAEITFIDRFAFYERTRSASCVVVTGTTRKYGNIILKKGVVDASV